jgi:hypothetical protein
VYVHFKYNAISNPFLAFVDFRSQRQSEGHSMLQLNGNFEL